MVDPRFDWSAFADGVKATEQDDGKLAGTQTREFLRQWQLSDIDRQQIIDKFMQFCYSAAKTLLVTTSFPTSTGMAPNRTGRLVTTVVPLDKDIQYSFIKGAIVPKTSYAPKEQRYNVIMDWDPVMRPIIADTLDPLYAGLAAARQAGIGQPKLQADKVQERENPVIDLAQPMILEMVARVATKIPWGKNPYEDNCLSYYLVLGMIENYPALIAQAVRDPLRFPGAQLLRDIEGIIYRRLNG